MQSTKFVSQGLKLPSVRRRKTDKFDVGPATFQAVGPDAPAAFGPEKGVSIIHFQFFFYIGGKPPDPLNIYNRIKNVDMC